MKLKTLKDIEFYDHYKPQGYVAWSHELRQEAIKWVNHYQHLEYIEKEAQISCEREIQWIMNFFNITEEELE